MAPEKDLERGQDSHNDFNSTNSTIAEREKDESSVGEPDIGHEEVEEMDNGHMDDLLRQHTRTSIKAGPEKSENDIERVQTNLSSRSTKNKISRIATALSSKTARSKKERLPPASLPVTDLDKGIVGWDSQTDPEMPLNFAENRKWLLLALLSTITFISPLASSMFAPAVSFMDKEFGNTSTLLSALTVSIFVLGYALGPLLLAPLSEIYGRRFVLTGANILFCIFQLPSALAPNLPSLIVFRLIAGIGGSGCITIGGGVIADLFQPDRRGLASSLYTLGPLFGPVIGPITGGFVAQRVGWRWVFWVLFIVSALVIVGIEFLNRETSHRVLIKRKTIRLRKELNRPELTSCYDTDSTVHSASEIVLNSMARPLKMLFRSPIVSALSLYMSVVYGLLYLLFTTITSVYREAYHWQPELTGLAYIGLGVGFLAGIIAVSITSDATVVRMTKANNGVFEPEMRLPTCIFFAFFIPISFFWYGWAVDKHVHWIVGIIGLMPFGFGMMGIFIPIQTYVIDSFPTFAASGLAALTISRSLFGAFLPLAGPKMYAKLGLGWGNSVLGFIAIGLIPVPLLIYRYGGMIRKNYPVKL